LLKPDPVTGKPNAENLAAFFAAHPETAAFRQWQARYEPTSSFANEIYNSINAFYLVNRKGQKQAVRWSAIPLTPSALALNTDDPSALQKSLIAQINEEPVIFKLVLTMATADDDENDPTLPWPSTRTSVLAGKIVIDRVGEQAAADCDVINFDPLVLPVGIQPTDDPILNARSAAYAESYRRRAREYVLDFLVRKDNE
jgi:catalase